MSSNNTSALATQNSSSSTSALIFCLACLQNPRLPEKASPNSTRILVDATFVIHQGELDCPPVTATALLHMYNRAGIVFNADADMYAMVVASLADVDTETMKEVLPGYMDEMAGEYSFMGEIHYIVPIEAELDALPDASAFMVLSGTVANAQRNQATWDMPVAQYCLGNSRRPLRTRVVIPDDPKRWRNGKKPVPWDLQVVTAAGPVIKVEPHASPETAQPSQPAFGTVAASASNVLTIAMDTIAFVGRSAQSIVPSAAPSPSPEKASRRSVKVATTAATKRKTAEEAPNEDNSNLAATAPTRKKQRGA